MIIWFGGGLGNQIFQYALYRSAQEKGYNTKANLSFYRNNNCHNGFELERVFNIKIVECTKMEADKFNNRHDIFSRVIRRLGFSKFGIRNNRIIESFSKPIAGLLNENNKNEYLEGYWQSERYFSEIRNLLREELIFPKLNEDNEAIGKEIGQTSSVSIHIRRGDYLNFPVYNNLGDTNYYNNAIVYLTDKRQGLKFYVFSDDMKWCKDNLNLSTNTVYIDWNIGKESYRDMQLMSMCKHNIIANSSYSWWGAWLNSNPTKTVVAPKRWFTNKSGYDDSMIVPDSWIKIDC